MIVSAMTEPEPPLPEPSLLLPNDVMPAVPDEPNAIDSAADTYEVAPILFVPSDVTPHPYGLAYVDRHMGNTQRWYAEQLRGKTFTIATEGSNVSALITGAAARPVPPTPLT